MKITFVLPYAGLAGGIRVVAIYAERLKKRGHKVTVVSVPKKPLTFKKLIKFIIKNKRWPSQKPGPSHFDNIDVEHKILTKHNAITNSDVPDADVVIATWWETAEWVNSFSAAKGRKIYFIQGYDVRPGLPKKKVVATYNMPFHKIVISNWLIDIMHKEYGNTNVSLVPNSVNYDFFSAPERGRNKVPTLGFMYAADHFKGCDIVIDAINKVHVSIQELKVIAFGACVPSSELPLPGNIEYYYQPSQEKIREIYSSCDFWLFGSRAEGFGLPLLEAMACRTPVIATRTGAAPELISQGGGFLIEKKNPDVMAEVILKGLKQSETKWKEMSNQARQTATQYSWDAAAELFERALLGHN